MLQISKIAVLLVPGRVNSRTSERNHRQLRQSHELKFIPNDGQLVDQFGRPMPEVLYTLNGAA